MDDTKEDPSNEDVSIIAILVHHVPESEQIQLLHTTLARDVDGKKDRPGDEATD